MGKVGLFVRKSVGTDEYGQERTRFNYEVQLGRIFCPIDALYVRDESGKDPLYSSYRAVLDSCADDKAQPIGLDPISLVCWVEGKVRRFYAVCGNVTVPIRVPNYSTEGAEDKQHGMREIMLYNACEIVRRRPAGLLSAPIVEDEEGEEEAEAVEGTEAPTTQETTPKKGKQPTLKETDEGGDIPF